MDLIKSFQKEKKKMTKGFNQFDQTLRCLSDKRLKLPI